MHTDYRPARVFEVYGEHNLVFKVQQVKPTELAFRHTMNVLLLTYRTCLIHCSDPCNSAAIELGNDVCLCTIWQLCGMRRPWQHMFNLQSEDARRQRAREPRAVRTQWLSLLLQISWWQPDRHQLRRHDLVGDDLFIHSTSSLSAL